MLPEQRGTGDRLGPGVCAGTPLPLLLLGLAAGQELRPRTAEPES